MYPGNVSTLCGLATNGNSQVLREYGTPVRGIYAAGNDQNSIWRGTYPAGGSWLSSAIKFGFVAAEHLAGPGSDFTGGAHNPVYSIPEK